MADSKVSALTELTAPILTDIVYGVDDPGGTPASRKLALNRALALLAPNPGGRLTLTTALPVTTSDVTAATTLYYTPHMHTLIRVYDGTSWKLHTLSEISIAIPATTDTNYDVFVYDNSGTLTLELTAWTDATTRATALTKQDGIYVKTGATTRLYLGTVRTTGTSGQTEDSASKRFVWNYYNRVQRQLIAIDTTNTWVYGTATWRAANNSTANRVELLTGVAENPITAQVTCRITLADNSAGSVGIGVDSTSANSAQLLNDCTNGATGSSISVLASALYTGVLSAGYHYLQWIEYGRAAGTVTFSGDAGVASSQSGLMAFLQG